MLHHVMPSFGGVRTMKILILAEILFWSCQTSLASYTIGILLNEFTNPKEKLLNGEYCDYWYEWKGLKYKGFYKRCDNKFRICLSFPNETQDEHNQCGVKGPYGQDFQRWKEVNVDLPVQHEEILMKIIVEDEDPGNQFQLVDKLARVFKVNAYQYWNREQAKQQSPIFTVDGHHTILKLRIAVYCNFKWFGPKCDCADMYPDGLQHYRCLQNGTKDCYNNYYGENCDKSCKATDDKTGHYTCAEDGSKICNKNWCNETCDVPCGESTTAQITYGTALTQTGAKTKTGKSNLIPIIGGVAGLVVLVTAIGLVVFFCKRKQRNQSVRTASMPMQSISVGRNYYGTHGDEINHSENLYDDAVTVGSMYEDAIAVRPMYDLNVDDATAGTSNDVYAVPDKKNRKQKGQKHDDMIDSDDMVVMENDVYDSAAEVRQQRAYKSGDAANITDDMQIMDNELYG